MKLHQVKLKVRVVGDTVYVDAGTHASFALGKDSALKLADEITRAAERPLPRRSMDVR